MDDNLDAQLWKQKYLDALDELEGKERHWSEAEQVLRQGLVRISLVADNEDAELNRLLDGLRRLLRGNGDIASLRALLEQLAEPIRRLDEARISQDLPPPPNELLERILGRLEFPRGMGHRAKAMQKRLLQVGDTPYKQLVDEFVALIIDALKWQDEADEDAAVGTEKRGLLGRLLPSRQNESPGEGDHLKLARQLLDLMLERLQDQPDTDTNSLQARIAASTQEAEVLRLGRELSGLLHLGPPMPVVDGEELSSTELMLRLLERLEIPSDLEEEASRIRETLEGPNATEQMEQVITAIADLISEMRHRVLNEKNEIEVFLNQLTERLREIDEGFQENVTSQRAAYAGGQRLNTEVDREIGVIEQTVSQAQDLDGLKVRIAERVDTIRQHMQQFRQDQDQRLAQAETQVRALSMRLDGMHKESEALRQRVKQQRDLAMVDPLTGVPNRLAYNERLAMEYTRWRRYGHELVLSVWDVDRFKQINDTYGHQAGDKVLTVIAKLLVKQVRETDFVARFGGEEFVLIMPETGLDGALKVAEHLRQSVEQCEFHFRGKRVPITISSGISLFQQDDTPGQVFARADAALYKAKAAGRNRCLIG
ncbi:MAG: GGDEF domain-containing protein [Chromatiales bacterium]|nr:GGDEF domain-containing protein [Gammaproteobacteria bacterium]MBW6476203.1 GGDEF domain-containing protein [Chromatiales bacterium]